MSDYDPVSLKILWDRLVAITDEIVLSLVRTSFSINVREGYDLSCILFDARGRTLGQGTYSVPSFTGTAPHTLRAMLAKFPPETLKPGDVVVTNDPWLGTGHLFDINIMRPVFRGDVIVGYTMSVTHLPDIGGSGMSSNATEVYQEGLRIPVSRLMQEGEPNELLYDIIRTNVRVADEVMGDIQANITCNEVGARALLDFMDEYGVDDLTPLSDAINDHSAQAMAAEIAAIPDGTYANAIDIEGLDGPIHLAATVTVSGDRVSIDFDGTDAPVRASINVPFCYTRAQSLYVIKCLTIPSLPNNEGAVRNIEVKAPVDSILNAQPPWPTGGRHSVGHFIVPLLMGALANALPERVQADSAMMNVFSVKGENRRGEGISSLFFLATYRSTAPDSGTLNRTVKHLLHRTINRIHLHMEISNYQIAAALLQLPSMIMTDQFTYGNPLSVFLLRSKLWSLGFSKPSLVRLGQDITRIKQRSPNAEQDTTFLPSGLSDLMQDDLDNHSQSGQE
ncbi:MAG: hydantoinase B/oxoprolinase family protein, partial [Pseudomonadota bacterium]